MRVLLSLLLPLAACTSVPVAPSAPAPSSETTATRLVPRLEDRIQTMMEAYGVEGLAVAVVARQETVLSRGFGIQNTGGGATYTSQTVCPLFSATKALSSFAVASIVEDGDFDIDAPLGDYLDDAPPEWRGIPFWRLLNHTSGITTIIDKPEFARIEANPASGNRDVYDVVRGLPLDYAPGQHSRYRQSGYAVAEMVLSDRLGETWPDLVAEHVTGPAGASHTVHEELASGARTSPLLTSAGGYRTTPDDMAAIFRALNAGRIVSPAFLERLLYADPYDFDGYSLGSTLEEIDGVWTLGHSGGGARATVRYVPSRQVGVAVFTDQTDNRDLAIHVADMLVREVALGQATLLPISAPLFRLQDAPAEEIVAFYRAAADAPIPEYDVSTSEGALNTVGYHLLRGGRTPDAITVFELNTKEHPASANTFDSLGEAYAEAGDLDRALLNYQRSLDLDPGNQNAEAMIARIRAERE